jgi:hypothetical protein
MIVTIAAKFNTLLFASGSVFALALLLFALAVRLGAF